MNPSTLASSSGSAAAETCGAIRGACVVVTAAGASGAVSVSVASGGVSGATAAAPSSEDPAGVVMGVLRATSTGSLEPRGQSLSRLCGPGAQMSVGMTFVPFFIRSRKLPVGNSRSLSFSMKPRSVRVPYAGATWSTTHQYFAASR